MTRSPAAHMLADLVPGSSQPLFKPSHLETPSIMIGEQSI